MEYAKEKRENVKENPVNKEKRKQSTQENNVDSEKLKKLSVKKGKEKARQAEKLNYEKHKDDVEKLKSLLKCDLCEETFTSETLIAKHTQVIHKKGYFSCSNCGKEFNFKQGLKKHQELYKDRHHFKCSKCVKILESEEEETEHLSIYHFGFKFHCNKCDEKFVYKYEQKSHDIKVHDGTLNCDNCLVTFSSISQFSRHIATSISCFTQNGEFFPCPKCNFKANTEIQFKKHMEKHKFPIIMTENHNCPKCSFNSESEDDLRRHLMAHSHKDQPKSNSPKVSLQGPTVLDIFSTEFKNLRNKTLIESVGKDNFLEKKQAETKSKGTTVVDIFSNEFKLLRRKNLEKATKECDNYIIVDVEMVDTSPNSVSKTKESDHPQLTIEEEEKQLKDKWAVRVE